MQPCFGIGIDFAIELPYLRHPPLHLAGHDEKLTIQLSLLTSVAHWIPNLDKERP